MPSYDTQRSIISPRFDVCRTYSRSRNFRMALSMRSVDWLASENSLMTIYCLRILSRWQKWERIEKLHPQPQGSCSNIVLKMNQMVCQRRFYYNNRSWMSYSTFLYTDYEKIAFAKERAAKVRNFDFWNAIFDKSFFYIVGCTVSLART